MSSVVPVKLILRTYFRFNALILYSRTISYVFLSYVQFVALVAVWPTSSCCGCGQCHRHFTTRPNILQQLQCGIIQQNCLNIFLIDEILWKTVVEKRKTLGVRLFIASRMSEYREEAETDVFCYNCVKVVV